MGGKNVKIIILAMVFACFSLSAATADGEHPSLPAVEGWTCGELRETRFETISNDQGYWQERSYRAGSGVAVTAILMGGPGPRFHGDIAPEVKSSDGPLGFGSEYKTLSLPNSGGLPLPAVLETHPLLGRSLAVKTPFGTLTIESGVFGANENEMVSITTRLIEEM